MPKTTNSSLELSYLVKTAGPFKSDIEVKLEPIRLKESFKRASKEFCFYLLIERIESLLKLENKGLVQILKHQVGVDSWSEEILASTSLIIGCHGIPTTQASIDELAKILVVGGEAYLNSDFIKQYDRSLLPEALSIDFLTDNLSPITGLGATVLTKNN